MMNSIKIEDDLFAAGFTPWLQKVRRGELSFQETIEHCFQKIGEAEKLDAFECLDSERAINTAKGLDLLLANGVDLGPLMGLPIGVKDIMACQGLPTTNGSNAETADLTGEEGEVVSALKKAGAVVLGKTKTVEFALGATGVNESRGTPWNPVDLAVHRMPGGSSSGSAVATAAGLIAMGLGTDTGGSIRIPACMTGIVGHKTSVGRWPLSGVFSLSSTLDSMGPLCRTVDDAIVLHQFVTREQVPLNVSLKGLRVGLVKDLFLDDLDEKVAVDFERACVQLEKCGVSITEISFPEVHERVPLFTSIVPAELIGNFTPERFLSIRDGIDSVTAARASVGLDVKAHDYTAAQQRRRSLIAKVNDTFSEVDVWISPTCPFLPISLDDMKSNAGHERALLASRNTQPGNLLDMCGLSIPMHREGLPTGLQLTMPHNFDRQLLAVGRAMESALNL